MFSSAGVGQLPRGALIPHDPGPLRDTRGYGSPRSLPPPDTCEGLSASGSPRPGCAHRVEDFSEIGTCPPPPDSPTAKPSVPLVEHS